MQIRPGAQMKYCTKCKLLKSISSFNRRSKSHDGRQSYCRECSKSFYRSNVERHKANSKRNSREKWQQNRKLLQQYLRSHPCVDCGESDIVVLDFDHVRGKKKESVTRLLDYAWKTIETEIAKCEVRCANCHRRRHAQKFAERSLPRRVPQGRFG